MSTHGDEDLHELLADQVTYYRERAPEYDRWWNRTHQYQLPDDQKVRWDAEVRSLYDWLEGLHLRGHVLELACGTGIWTSRLVEHAATLTAVDASAEVLAINRERIGPGRVRFVEADLFSWEPDRRYDAVFFGFWLSHVPPPLLDKFWEKVRDALRGRGTVVFVDNLWRPGTWPSQRPAGFVQERTDLSDGSRHRVVKVYHEPSELSEDLLTLGWEPDVRATDTYFLYGTATRTD